MPQNRNSFNFLKYLAENNNGNGHADPDRLPSLTDLSEEMGVSISSLREQLEVARALGFVEVRPRTGIRRLPYAFGPSISESLSYAIALDRSNFDAYADLRKKVEADYWHDAVKSLTDVDKQELSDLVDRALEKLHGDPIQLPHQEHRQLHLTIFRHIENPFVTGILEAYWDAYEEVGLNRYERLEYHEEVWSFHQRMVAAIAAGDFDLGYRALVDHFELINARPSE
ncbi:MAG: FadR family transcriptional regulator [Chloroflexi bacterium]|nr:FadR family transcriptional regulator [Chloroflexota bacterium]